MRQISAVVFDVLIEPDDHRDVEVMQRVFARSSGVQLRARSALTYQSGDYERTLPAPEVWTGRLERIRTGPVSTVVEAPDGSFHFVDEDVDIPTSHATTYYAFVPAARLLVYLDSAEMPYTRLASYVSGALQQATDEGVLAWCELVPRKISRPLREWIQHFTRIERVRVQFRHSQSPGNRAIDSILEQLNADTATEIVAAAPRGDLNKEALLDTALPIGKALDHLEKAPRNGEAEISGHVGEQPVKFNTTSPVERHIIEVEDDVPEMRSTLARFAAKLMSIGLKT
ncbi:MAG: hypothetical protein JW940_14460 [Polyangiaceae bacterium]|nr:hypothetical protein [Polyangiaceae bacterium]